MKVNYPNGCEFDIMVLSGSGPPYEPDAWWRFWFQGALDGIMNIEPPPPRAYFFRLLVITALPTWATPASFDLMGTCWNGEEEFREFLKQDITIAAAPDLIKVNLIENEPPRLAAVLLVFAAALVREFVHLTKHATSHKNHLLECEREAHAAQRKFIYRAAKTFGVPPVERDEIIRLNKEAQRVRTTSLRG